MKPGSLNLLAVLSMGLAALAIVPAAAQPAPSAQRHDLSEICAGGDCVWEKHVTCSGFLEGINFDANGTLWMVGYLEGRIIKVQNGECVTVGEQSGFPNGMKIAPDGNLIVADRTGGLQSVDPVTGEREVIHSQYITAQFRGLNDLAFDPQGGMYFTEPYGSDALKPVGRVYYIAPGEGSKPELFLDGVSFPNGIALSPDGNRVFLSEYGQNRIIAAPSKLNPNIFESATVLAQLQGGIGPDGLTVDADGNLYIAHFGAGQVFVLDPQGFPYGIIRLPESAGPFTTNVAIHGGHLYVTEAIQNVVWRLPITRKALGEQ